MASFALIVAVASLVFGSAAVVNTEKVKNFRLCRKDTKCSITDLSIDPCPEALENKQCELPQGVNGTLAFNFTSKFTSKEPKVKMFASITVMDLPFRNMNPNACLYTQCPIRANTQQSWLYNLIISHRFPKGSYTIKFKLSDGEPKADLKDECCFKFFMKIV